MRILRPEQTEEWLAVLRRCRQHDAYHLPWYHAQAERHGEGVARLFVHEEGGHLIALPLLLRSLRSVPGLEGAPAGCQDATSVYGYAGPVSSPEVPEWVVRGFQAALAQTLREEQVVTVFSRLHPLIPQTPLLDGLGLCIRTGRTVAIDLTPPPEVQRGFYRRNCRHGINRLRRLGVTCREDPEFHHLDDFARIYDETMRRVGAPGHLCFSPSHFHDLVAAGGAHIHLLVCLLDEQVISGGLFLECGDFAQYHLGGTLGEYLALSPSKLLLDVARMWAHGRGRRALHLGGGTTGRPDDPLLYFKTSFSDRTYDFLTWRWVVSPPAYAQLLDLGARWNEQQGLVWTSADYFPAYRAGTKPAPTTFPEHHLATDRRS
jgi:hypothetical protein